MVFDIELCLYLPNSHTLFLFRSHFRSLNKTKDLILSFLQILHLNCSTNVSQFPHSLPFTSHPLSNHPITICCQHTILPKVMFCFFLSKWTWPTILKWHGFLNLSRIAFRVHSPQYALKGAHKHVIVRWAKFSQSKSFVLLVNWAGD